MNRKCGWYRGSFRPQCLTTLGFFVRKYADGVAENMEREEEMKEKLEQIKAEAMEQIRNSEALERLNDVRVNVLGKKGALTAVLKSMKDGAPEDRPKVGQLVNETRAEIERVLEETVFSLKEGETSAPVKNDYWREKNTYGIYIVRRVSMGEISLEKEEDREEKNDN